MSHRKSKRIEALEDKVFRLEVDLALERQDPQEMARLGLSMDGAANRETMRIVKSDNLKVISAELLEALENFHDAFDKLVHDTLLAGLLGRFRFKEVIAAKAVITKAKAAPYEIPQPLETA